MSDYEKRKAAFLDDLRVVYERHRMVVAQEDPPKRRGGFNLFVRPIPEARIHGCLMELADHGNLDA